MSWSTPKTDWTTNDGIGTADLNRMEANIEYLDAKAHFVESGSFTLTFPDTQFSSQVDVACKYNIWQYPDIGKVATVSIPGFDQSSISTDFASSNGMPAAVRPTLRSAFKNCVCLNDTVRVNAYMLVNYSTGAVSFDRLSHEGYTGWASSGYKGFLGGGIFNWIVA